jgi:pimeloyl-ACP methyl ester carboxylesterase
MSRRRRLHIAVVMGAVVTLLLPGCGGASPDAKPSPVTSSADAKPNTVVAQCGPDGATGFVVPVAGGKPVEAASFGTGKLAVVLSHEWTQSPCPWAAVAKRVAARGYRAVIWEYGGLTGLDRVKELQAIVDRLRADGATKVVLAGGSIGGCLSIIGATEVKPPVDGVVVLSCAVWYDTEWQIPTRPYAAKVTVPTLYAVGDQDNPTLVAGVRTDANSVVAKDRTLLVVRDSFAHGVALFDDPTGGPQLWKAFLGLLDRVAGRPGGFVGGRALLGPCPADQNQDTRSKSGGRAIPVGSCSTDDLQAGPHEASLPGS